jgi:hypothetical protein
MVVIQYNEKVLLMLLDVFKAHPVCLSMADEVLSKYLSIEYNKNIYLWSIYSDRRLLNDLWFLQAAPQDALNSPRSRRCTYPFSYYHLHGIFQFFTYGIIFPIGYLVGRHGGNLPIKRPLHMGLQVNKYLVLIYN